MYQFEKHVASTNIWRVPYGLRAELTKEATKGHPQRQLKQILLSHALNYALHEVSLSSDRMDVIRVLSEMRDQYPFNEIRAWLEKLSFTLWRDSGDDDDDDAHAARIIEEIRRARRGDDLVTDAFLAAHSSVLRELAHPDLDRYRERLYKIFPELNPLRFDRSDSGLGGYDLIRGFALPSFAA
jgi:hypothetical protein